MIASDHSFTGHLLWEFGVMMSGRASQSATLVFLNIYLEPICNCIKKRIILANHLKFDPIDKKVYVIKLHHSI